MNSTDKRQAGARGVPQTFNLQAGNAVQNRPVVAQLKTGVQAQGIRRPVAPPAYRPQANPVCVQAKLAGPSQSKNPPAAPPVYRPQPVPKVLQSKSAPVAPPKAGQPPRHSITPPVNRPLPKKIMQPKTAGSQGPKNPSATQPHRPQPAPKVLQLKKRDAVIQRTYGSATTAPQPGKLEYGKATDATTGMMIIFRGYDAAVIEERTFTSGGRHAEEKAIARVQELVNNGTLVAQGQPVKDYILYLALSKSPCSSTSVPATRTDGNPGCHELLVALNNGGYNGVTFDVQLAATKPYSPKTIGGKNASTNTYGGFGGDGNGGGTFGFVR